MKSAALTDIGSVREENEDFFIVGDGFAAVADGMGGHSSGELASRTAIENVGRALPAPLKNPRQAIRLAFQKANAAVLQKARELGHEGMGTTLTLAALSGRTLWAGHIGDSRLYLLRDGRLEQMTQDHTLVAELMRTGQLAPENAKNHPRRNIITKAIGGQTAVVADIFSFDVRQNDRLLLCTDGLSSYMEPFEIERLVQGGTPDDACRRLVEAANEAGGVDNVTVVVMDVSDDEPPAAPRRRTWVEKIRDLTKRGETWPKPQRPRL